MCEVEEREKEESRQTREIYERAGARGICGVAWQQGGRYGDEKSI